MERKIIHVDLDAFFAAVEVQDNPKLKGKPVIVGGNSRRGIVTTCSYEARSYGIHSAMPIFMAKQKCPHGIYVPTRHWRYKEVSREVFDIFYRITDLVEPLSIDEAYLDVTDLGKSSIEIVKYIKNQVLQKTGLTLSAGISYNKFLAKLASDWNKPNGIKVITKEMVPDILKPLPIKKVHGIGRKSEERLNEIGVFTIEDLLELSEEYLIGTLGRLGIDIYNRIRGIDNRNVDIGREVKSIGRETTLKEDTRDKEYMKKILWEFSKDIGTSLQKRGLYTKTITIKIKEADFTNHTKSRTINHAIYSPKDIYKAAEFILDNMEFKKDIRLIGLSSSNLSEVIVEQLSFL